MKFFRTFLGIALIFVIGCASVTIPSYITDKNPYKRTYYGMYQEVLDATNAALKDLGWAVEGQAEPATFERSRVMDANLKQTLIFTKVRQTSMVLGSRYARMNIFVREQVDNQAEVEVRYVTVSSVGFKAMYDYTEDRAVNHILDSIQKKLE